MRAGGMAAMLAATLAALLAGCGSRSVAGTYNVVDAPVKGATVTFGNESFSFSTGASGRYEVSGDQVILTGDMVSGTFRRDGDRLVGDRFTFVPRAADDRSPVNLGPRGMSDAR